MNRIEPGVVLLTGASRGLGAALADGLSQAGWTIAGCGRTEASMEEMNRKFGPPHMFSAVDVANNSEVEAWVQSVNDSVGTPDLVLNNAAIINDSQPLWDVPPEEFSLLMDINVKGTYHVLRAVLPGMIARGSGMLVNFSSGWGRSTSPDVAPYCASKFAIEGLSRALADELPPGLAVVALNPGIIHTEMLESCFGAGAEHYPSAAEWAQRAIPFLLDLDISQNGQSLSVI